MVNKLSHMSDKQLFKLRFSDLCVAVERSWVRPMITELYDELTAKGLRLRPHTWFATEWFCADGVPGIAVPFYLAHPRLAELEAKMMGMAEGFEESWCMQLLRHETGHVVDNAYGLRRLRQRQENFGLSTSKYPNHYRPNPTSRDYVIHLEDHYAQAHPDEDWAETFAVWLDPQSQWRKTYESWPALRKLLYVDRLMTSLQGTLPFVHNRSTPGNIRDMQQTLGAYYRTKVRKQGLFHEQHMKSDSYVVAM